MAIQLFLRLRAAALSQGKHAADTVHAGSQSFIGTMPLKGVTCRSFSHSNLLVSLVPNSHVLQVRWWTWWPFCTPRQM